MDVLSIYTAGQSLQALLDRYFPVVDEQPVAVAAIIGSFLGISERLGAPYEQTVQFAQGLDKQFPGIYESVMYLRESFPHIPLTALCTLLMKEKVATLTQRLGDEGVQGWIKRHPEIAAAALGGILVTVVAEGVLGVSPDVARDIIANGIGAAAAITTPNAIAALKEMRKNAPVSASETQAILQTIAVQEAVAASIPEVVRE